MKRHFFLAFFLIISPLHAQTQGEMNITANVDFGKSDKKLNDIYKKIAATLDSAGKRKLVASEKAWLAYRNNQAEFEADYVARGGSMAPLIYNEARVRITDARIKELKDSISVK